MSAPSRSPEAAARIAPGTRSRRFLTVLAYVTGIYLIARAVAEPFVIDLSDASSYHLDWGGPHLLGVLAVHMLPGVAWLAAILWHRRRVRAARSTRT